jgi:hypothetical protein
MPTTLATAAERAHEPRIRNARIVLIAVGVLVLIVGIVVLFATNRPNKILGLGSWLILALIVHDGIIAAITFGVSFSLRKAGRAVPNAVIGIISGALVIASIFAIIVVPAIYKKSIGARNPTVLPLDYAPALFILWAVLVVLTGVGIALYYRLRRRRP